MEHKAPADIQKPTPFPYTREQKLLLLFALLLGIFFDRAWQADCQTRTEVMLLYSGFWAVYLILFLLFSWKRAAKNVEGWLLAGAFLILAVRGLIYEQAELFFLNLAVIPCLLMLHAAVVNLDLPKGKESGYFVAFFKGWFVWPFSALGKCFGAIAAVFRTRKEGNARKVLYGALIALPLIAIVGALLLNADGVMSFYFSDFFRNLRLGNALCHVVLILVVTMLFYSFLFNALWSRKLSAAATERKSLPALTLYVVLGALLLVYAVFAYVQFAYLMGLKGLPQELTYAEYARQGFSELIWVTLINLAVFSLCLCHGEQTKSLRALLFALLFASLILLYSAAMRLLLYIDAYGLTFMRLLPLWFMVFLLFVFIMCAAKLMKPKTHLLRIAAMALLCWYVLLNLVNVDGIIAKSILDRAEKEGQLGMNDYHYVVYTLSSDAEPVRKEHQALLHAAADTE